GVRDPRDPRRTGAGGRDRLRQRADLPDVDLRAGRRRRPPRRPRLRAHDQSDPDRAAGVPRRPRRGPPRGRLRVGHGGHERRARDLRRGQPRAGDQRRLRRHVPALLEGPRAAGLPLRLRGHLRSRRRGTGARGGRRSRLDRDADEPAAEGRRHRHGGRTRPCRRCRRRRRLDVRLAVPADAARARRRRGRALDDEVHRRALGRRRRRGGHRRRRAGRASALPAERDRRRPRAARLLPDAARREDAGRPDAGALPERATRRRAPGARRRRARRDLAGPRVPSGPRRGGAADARLRRHGRVPGPRRPRGGRRAPGRHRRLVDGREPRRRREPDRASGRDDARVARGLGLRGVGRPDPPVRGDRARRRPARRPRADARRRAPRGVARPRL
ncbi:MAG: Cystathionine gamma-lyase, partial [uncultured Thermoleophilia bacterium]